MFCIMVDIRIFLIIVPVIISFIILTCQNCITVFDNDEYIRDALEKIATASNINLGHYDYENTEIIREEHLLNKLSFDDVVGMRNEIIELKKKNNLHSWQDALESYKTNLTGTKNLVFDNENNRSMVISEGNDNYTFDSRNLRNAVNALKKEFFIHNLENLIKEDSYIS